MRGACPFPNYVEKMTHIEYWMANKVGRKKKRTVVKLKGMVAPSTNLIRFLGTRYNFYAVTNGGF